MAGINDIKVNKKKRGNMIIQNQRVNEEQFTGCLVKNWYKFLGVRLANNLSLNIHLMKTS